MTRIRDILDAAFVSLSHLERATGGTKAYATQKEKAERLGTVQSYYSKMTARRSLPQKLAQRWAASLWPEDLHRQEQLTKALMATDPDLEGPPGKFIRAVERFFHDLVAEVDLDDPQTFPFLLVEYRDRPRAKKDSRYPSLGGQASVAVRKGLRMAQVQPFARPSFEEGKAPPPRDIYQLNIMREAEEVGVGILEGAISATPHRNSMTGQVVLYEPKKGIPASVTGIGSRVFYANYLAEGGRMSEVWEWVSAEPHDVFVQRDREMLPPEVFRDQFHPIFDYWLDNNHRLASEVKELDDYAGSDKNLWIPRIPSR